MNYSINISKIYFIVNNWNKPLISIGLTIVKHVHNLLYYLNKIKTK